MLQNKVPHTLSKESVDELKALFNLIDADKSGSVTKEEFTRAIQANCAGISKSSIDFCFFVADTNHDKEIDFEEFLNLFWLLTHKKEDQESVELVFKAFDQDSNGFLSKDELLEACRQLGVGCTQRQISALYSHFDSNHDGKMNFQEFYRFYLRLSGSG